MERILITSETVLPISSPPINRGAVLIGAGKIIDLGESSNLKKRYKSIRNLNLGSGILLPGFINAHIHLELGWVKNKIGQFNGFIGWLQQVIKVKMELIKREEIEKSVEEGISELLESGVTTVGEISSYGGLDKPLLKRSGLRTVLFSELFDWHGDFWEIFSFEKGETFEERPFPHAPYSCSPDFLRKVLKFYHKKRIPVGIHLAESYDEVKFLKGERNGFDKKIFPMIGKEPFLREKATTPFQYLNRLKFFEETKVTAVHMVHVLPQEIEEINKCDLGIVLCPRSNFFLKVGAPPVKGYTNLERIGIGTDGLSSNLNLDFLEELRFFYLTLAKSLGEKASFFTVYLATLGGAKALFLEDRIGSIEKGKEADLIFLASENTSANPYFSVISSCKKDVKMVMVKGKIIYQS
jgi:cytosine/adenosine deaminase-related metal-dependent hydrolase